MQATYDTFARDFLLPLLTGGIVQVGKPMAPACLDFFGHAHPSTNELHHQVLDALAESAWRIWPCDNIPYPEPGMAAIALASYNLARASDPRWQSWPRSRAARTTLDWVDTVLDHVAPPSTVGQALTRHAVVSRLVDLGRTDTSVATWVGKGSLGLSFYGRHPDRLTLALPTIRRVKVSEAQTQLIDAWRATEQVWPRVRALVRCSPVTELLCTDVANDLDLGAASLVLIDRGLRGGIARTTENAAALAERVCLALGPFLERTPPRARLLGVALFIESLVARVNRECGRLPPTATSVFAALAPLNLSTLSSSDRDARDELIRTLDTQRESNQVARQLAAALTRVKRPSHSTQELHT